MSGNESEVWVETKKAIQYVFVIIVLFLIKAIWTFLGGGFEELVIIWFAGLFTYVFTLKKQLPKQ